MGLWRAVILQARADAPVVAAAWVLLVCAITLVAAGSHYGDAIGRGGLRQTLLEIQPGDRAVVARTRAPLVDVPGLDSIVRPELERAIRMPGGTVGRITNSGAFLPGEASGATTGGCRVPEGGIVRLAAFQGIDEHGELVDGRWAESGAQPVEATVSEGAAGAFGVTVGDVIPLRAERGGEEIDLLVVGIWQQGVADAYWLGSALEIEGVAVGSRVTEFGPLVVTEEDLVAHAPPGSAAVEWRALPDPEGFRADDLDATIADIAALSGRLRAQLSRDRQAQVATVLPDVLGATSRSIVVSRSGVLLLSLQFAVLAAYAVVLVAGVIVERRRAQVALLRSRRRSGCSRSCRRRRTSRSRSGSSMPTRSSAIGASPSCSTSWGSASAPGTGRTSCPAGNSSVSRWPGRSPIARPCCSPTSRPASSTPRPGTGSCSCSGTSSEPRG